jgi:hypothetical protein
MSKAFYATDAGMDGGQKRSSAGGMHPVFPMKISLFDAFFYCAIFKKHDMFSTTER